MAYTPKPGSFSLFKNDKKATDAQPSYRGDGVLPDGTAAWISAWVKEGKNGKFFSISIQPKEERPSARDAAFPRSAPGRVAGRRDDDPFAGEEPF